MRCLVIPVAIVPVCGPVAAIVVASVPVYSRLFVLYYIKMELGLLRLISVSCFCICTAYVIIKILTDDMSVTVGCIVMLISTGMLVVSLKKYMLCTRKKFPTSIC